MAEAPHSQTHARGRLSLKWHLVSLSSAHINCIIELYNNNARQLTTAHNGTPDRRMRTENGGLGQNVFVGDSGWFRFALVESGNGERPNRLAYAKDVAST